MQNSIVVAIDKKNREEIRILTKEFKGRRSVDVRIYASGQPGEEKWPTGKGLLIPAEEWGLFLQGIIRTEKELKENGWLHE